MAIASSRGEHVGQFASTTKEQGGTRGEQGTLSFLSPNRPQGNKGHDFSFSKQAAKRDKERDKERDIVL
jgi:hypothetical protein